MILPIGAAGCLLNGPSHNWEPADSRPVCSLPQLWTAFLVRLRQSRKVHAAANPGRAGHLPRQQMAALQLSTPQSYCLDCQEVQDADFKHTGANSHALPLLVGAGGFAAGKASLLKATNNQPWQQQYWTNADSWMSSLFFPAMGISPCSALSQNVCIENKADYLHDGFIGGTLLMQAKKNATLGEETSKDKKTRGPTICSHCPLLPFDGFLQEEGAHEWLLVPREVLVCLIH